MFALKQGCSEGSKQQEGRRALGSEVGAFLKIGFREGEASRNGLYYRLLWGQA